MIAILESGRWWHAASYAAALAGGRPALAWEMLRRDSDYCAEAARRRRPGATVSAWDSASVARWGLHFPM